MRRRLTAALTGIALTVAFGCWLLVPRSSAICKANFDRLGPGMSLGEVEEILGGPARDESTGHILPQHIIKDLPLPHCTSEIEARLYMVNAFRAGIEKLSRLSDEVFFTNIWISDTAIVRAALDEAGGVSRMDFMAVCRDRSSTFTERVQTLLRRYF